MPLLPHSAMWPEWRSVTQHIVTWVMQCYTAHSDLCDAVSHSTLWPGSLRWSVTQRRIRRLTLIYPQRWLTGLEPSLTESCPRLTTSLDCVLWNLQHPPPCTSHPHSLMWPLFTRWSGRSRSRGEGTYLLKTVKGLRRMYSKKTRLQNQILWLINVFPDFFVFMHVLVFLLWLEKKRQRAAALCWRRMQRDWRSRACLVCACACVICYACAL